MIQPLYLPYQESRDDLRSKIGRLESLQEALHYQLSRLVTYRHYIENCEREIRRIRDEIEERSIASSE